MRQLSFFKNPNFEPLHRLSHGGDIRRGKRKLARPFDRRRAMHLVLRAERARGKLSLLAHARSVEKILRVWGRHYGVQIYHFANVGNHLHLAVRARSRLEFQNFLRVVTGKIAQLILRAVKGRPSGRFWSALAFSRVVSLGREFVRVIHYINIKMNADEARGLPSKRTRIEAPPPKVPPTLVKT